MNINTNIIKSFTAGKNIILIISIFICVTIILVPQVPLDDYWRHYISQYYDYHYSYKFFETKYPDYNFWIGYDVFVALLSKLFGVKTYIAVQSLVILLIGISFWLIAGSDNYNTVLASFLIMLVLIFPRIITARPTILCGATFALLWFWDNRIVRVVVPALFSFMYWLFFIPLLPLLTRERLVIIPLIFGFFFWHIYSGGKYFDDLYNAFLMVNNLQVPIREFMGLIVSYTDIIIILFPVIMLYSLGMGFRQIYNCDRKTFWAIAYFCAINQIRFLYDYAFFLLASVSRFIRVNLPNYVIILIFSAFLYIILSGTAKTDVDKIKSELVYFNNKKILSVSPHYYFLLLYALPDSTFTPSQEFNWATDPVKRVVYDINTKNTVSCYDIVQTDADFLIEDRLVGDVPSCLQLVKMYNNMRVWQIIKVKDQLGVKNESS